MGLSYRSEFVDRKTGEVVTLDQGYFVTVTEFAHILGIKPRLMRKAMLVMGIVAPEGAKGTYRLTWDAVRRGYGKRIDRPKAGKYPFDVLSPEGQRLITENLASSLREVEESRTPDAKELQIALRDYVSRRRSTGLPELTMQQEVCWLADNFPTVNAPSIAAAIDGAPGVVRVYLSRRAKQRRDAEHWASKKLHSLEACPIVINDLCPSRHG